ncbi:MAG: hypothetical protein PHG66_03565 [Candidatus Colwellbacteria bacterium]|nr:hypothetical protein [Candidatus Colwellbacteria bacterium]
MKKIGILAIVIAIAALGFTSALAEVTTETNTASGTISAPTVSSAEIEKTKENTEIITGYGKDYFVCMGKAISVREDAFISGLSAFNSSTQNAYAIRKTSLISAWNSSDDRNVIQKAVNDAEKTFKDTRSAAEKNWSSVQKKTSEDFNVSKTACIKLSTAIKPTTSASTQQSLLEMIKQLQAQIKELQAKLTAPKPATTIAPASTTTQTTVGTTETR